MTLQIRDATTRDAPGIAEILTDAILHTTVTWDETPVDADDRENWITDHQSAGFPVLVAVDTIGNEGEPDRVLGHAAFGPWRAWDGYRHTVEHSVYVRHDQRGRGVGTALLTALIERAKAQEIHVMVAGIDAENSGSIRLHERLGFTSAGRFHEVGTKFGQWRDLVFLQLTID